MKVFASSFLPLKWKGYFYILNFHFAILNLIFNLFITLVEINFLPKKPRFHF